MTIETLKCPNPRNRNSIFVIKSKFLSFPYSLFQIATSQLKLIIVCKTLKKEGPVFRNIGRIIYIPDRKISLASFVSYIISIVECVGR